MRLPPALSIGVSFQALRSTYGNTVGIRREPFDFENFLDEVPGQALVFLRTIPIWVSNEPGYPLRENENGVIPFHRSPQWLRNHNLNPHMAPGVHVINPEAVFFEHKFLE